MTIELINKIPSGGLYPGIQGKKYGAAGNGFFGTSGQGEGFAGNGDYVRFPTSGGNSAVGYYDNVDALQWSKTPTNINAACNNWVGMTFDETDGLIYVVAVNTGTSPNTYYTASINSAGTIVNIGNDQPSSDFSTNPEFAIAITASGSSGIQREEDGSGNLFARSSDLPAEEAEINISTGVFVSDPAEIFPNYVPISLLSALLYKNSDGVYIGHVKGNSNGFLNTQVAKTTVTMINFPMGLGLPFHSSGLKITAWKSSVLFHEVSRVSSSGPFGFDRTEFDAWLNDLADVSGAL